jgi:hypothetical protein
MLVFALICIMTILFLLICLQGFQSALKQRRSLKATLVAIREDGALVLPRRQPRVISFPAQLDGAREKPKTFVESRRSRR